MPPDFVADPAVGAFARFMLWALILWGGVQLGGGLYEKQAVVPLWSQEPTPDGLGERLAACGATGSSTRFWPFVSPAVFLLALANGVLAWQSDGPARPWWLAAAGGFAVMSVCTYAYFVPTMLSLMHRANTYTPEQLTHTVSWWLALSNGRLLLAVPAWLAAVKALTLLGGRAGWRL